MTAKEAALQPGDARQIAWDYRQRFANAEVFEAAWNALFELKTAITPHLARRFLSEELAKYRAHVAGLEEPPPETPAAPSASPTTYVCPGCHRTLDQWARLGHEATCRHVGCYELEVKFREEKRRVDAVREARKSARET